MKATLEKSIGNTYLIKVDGKYYDLIFFKSARSKLNKFNTLKEVNDYLSSNAVEINVSEKNHDIEKIESYLCEQLHWIDKRRNLKSIIGFGIEKRLIKIAPYKFSGRKCGFEELENPNVNYYIVVNRVEINISKPLFNYLDGKVEVVEIRAV